MWYVYNDYDFHSCMVLCVSLDNSYYPIEHDDKVTHMPIATYIATYIMQNGIIPII